MIQFYAKALNPQGRVEQLLISKEPGKPTRPEWTGKVYRDDGEADRDITALNVAIAKKTRSFERMLGE